MVTPLQSKIGTKVDIGIMKTKKYDAFILVNGIGENQWNRELRESNLRKLRRSMGGNGGYRMDRPIVVYWDQKLSKYVIVDGQHRFTVAMELGEEFSYVVSCDKENAIATARTLNTAQTIWDSTAYVKCFAATGNHDYQLLSDLAREYSVSIANVASLLRGYTRMQSRTTTELQNGEFQAKHKEYAIRCLNIIRALCDNYGLKKHRNYQALISAVAKMCLVKKFNEKQLYRKIDSGVRPQLCVDCAQYLEEFERIYNYRQTEGGRLDLAKLAQYETDKRNACKSKDAE